MAQTGPFPRRLPRTGPWFALAALAGLGAWCLPLYLCEPHWVDNAFFDVCARVVLSGGVLFREVFIHGPPGMVLAQAAARRFVGWSSEALAAVDFVIVSAVVCLLARAFLPRGTSARRRLWTVAALYLFYFSTSEWCHAQPDVWMLLPALGALWLRQRQSRALERPDWSATAVLAGGVAEGVLWGLAFCIKPFVAVPAVACWLTSAAMLNSLGRRATGRLLADALAVLAGGLAVGAAMFVWLRATGNWSSFVDANFGGWNEEYYAASAPLASRSFRLFAWLWPWGLVHLVAVPVALAWAAAAFAGRLPRSAGSRPLLSAFYLAWLFQAHYLQRQMPYQAVPPVLLAVTLLAGRGTLAGAVRLMDRSAAVRWSVIAPCAGYALALGVAYSGWMLSYARSGPVGGNPGFQWEWTLPLFLALTLVAASRTGRAALLRLTRRTTVPASYAVVFCGLALVSHPLLRPQRLAVWTRCWREGSTPEIRDRLAIEETPVAPDWVELQAIRRFLEGQRLRDRELTCYALSAVHLYPEMDLAPSTRFVLLRAAILNFQNHQGEIAREIDESPQRYIVNDLRQWDLSEEDAHIQVPGRPWGLPPVSPERAREFPWTYPVVFREGRYLVHAAKPPDRPAATTLP